MEYNIWFPPHGHITTILLRHNGEEWTELPPLPYESTPWVEIVNVDLVGFVWECDGWSLYTGARNTEYQLGSAFAKDTTLYQSRDYGASWVRISAYGRRYWEPPAAPILPPNNAVLATGYYNESQELLTRFAWKGDDRSLYAFTYLATPTPNP